MNKRGFKEVIRNGSKKGISTEDLSQLTGLTAQEIEELKKEL